MTISSKKIVRRAVPADAEQRFPGLHPVLQRIFSLRELKSEAELSLELAQLYQFDCLGQIEHAVALLETAIKTDKRVLIVADFDADGATSCAVAVRALRLMGASQVAYLVPNRFEYGYGLTPEIVAVALNDQPQLIITVDNGIASIEGVSAAKKAGIEVIITDHHLPGEQLPDADAIINPNVPGDAFPSKNLAGVGVVFYLMIALRARLRQQSWFVKRGLPDPNLAELLDLVALGTVADVVPLDRNNRILVHQGIKRIRSNRCCEGIRALFKVAGKSCHAVVSSDLGFRVGPRLNAAGRLQDMSIGIECLLTDDSRQALALAEQLDNLNKERKAIEKSMQQQALKDLQTVTFNQNKLPFGLCIFRQEWHQGVIGILASRIRETYNRPVIAFAPADNGELKGSARSVAGLHIRDTLDAVARSHPEILSRFGGHAMAAGLSIRRDDYEQFSSLFDHEVKLRLDGKTPDNILLSDGALTGSEISYELADAIKTVSPWGQHFPEPLFDGLFRVLDSKVVGVDHLKMVLSPINSDQSIDAIAFNQVRHLDDHGADCTIHAAYRLDINDYRGLKKEQLIIEFFEAVKQDE